MSPSRLASLVVAFANVLIVFLHHGTVLRSSETQRSLAGFLILIALCSIWFADSLPSNERQPGDPPYDLNGAMWLNFNLGPKSYVLLGWVLLVGVLPIVTILTCLVKGP